jgi:DNA-directed RNA polymerase subunit RPC12/RpoP
MTYEQTAIAVKREIGMSDTARSDDNTEVQGIECPRCGCGHFSTGWVRHKNKMVVRRRDCRHCGKKVMTYEQTAIAVKRV